MPSDEETVPMQVRLPKATDARLRAEAEARMVAPQLLVNKAVEKFLAELIPVDEAIRTVAQAVAQAGHGETRSPKLGES